VSYNRIGIGNDLNNAIRISSHDPWNTVSWDWDVEPRRMRRFPEADIVCGEIRVAFQIRTRYQEENSEIFRGLEVGGKKEREKENHQRQSLPPILFR